MWKGATPGISRAMAAALGLFTSYETAKEKMKVAMPQAEFLGFVIASFIAGGFASFISLPFDNAKTKMQNQKPNPDGTLPYRNILHAMQVCVKDQGVGGLWVGIPSYVMRIAPHVIVSMLVLEQLKKLVGNA